MVIGCNCDALWFRELSGGTHGTFIPRQRDAFTQRTFQICQKMAHHYIIFNGCLNNENTHTNPYRTVCVYYFNAYIVIFDRWCHVTTSAIHQYYVYLLYIGRIIWHQNPFVLPSPYQNQSILRRQSDKIYCNSRMRLHIIFGLITLLT